MLPRGIARALDASIYTTRTVARASRRENAGAWRRAHPHYRAEIGEIDAGRRQKNRALIA